MKISSTYAVHRKILNTSVKAFCDHCGINEVASTQATSDVLNHRTHFDHILVMCQSSMKGKLMQYVYHYTHNSNYCWGEKLDE